MVGVVFDLEKQRKQKRRTQNPHQPSARPSPPAQSRASLPRARQPNALTRSARILPHRNGPALRAPLTRRPRAQPRASARPRFTPLTARARWQLCLPRSRNAWPRSPATISPAFHPGHARPGYHRRPTNSTPRPPCILSRPTVRPKPPTTAALEAEQPAAAGERFLGQLLAADHL